MLKDYCNDNELYNELSCNKGTFDDEIDYYLGKADQDNESHKVCNKDEIAKSDSDDLSANNSHDNINIHHSSSSTSSNDNSVSGDTYSDNLLVSEDIETDHGNLLVSGDIDNDHCSHDDFLVNGDTSDDHNQSNEDEPLLDNSDMDFLGKSGKSGSAKDDIKFLPDLFNDIGQLQETVNTELCDMNFFGSSNDIQNVNDSPQKCKNLGSGEHIINDIDESVKYNPYELNFYGSCDPTTLVQAIVPMKGLDVCLMEEDNLASFVDEQLWNLRDFIVIDWPNSKTDIPVYKLCHWFLQDELGYYSGVLMKGS